MGKTFRNWEPEQRFLLRPAVDEFVPPGHSAHFVRDLVAEQLNLTAILDTYTEERGYPPYHRGGLAKESSVSTVRPYSGRS